MPYTAPTLTQAIAALASRLNDPANVHWTSDELHSWLIEALRTWQAWTSHWRDRGTLTLADPDTFYDLTTDLSGNLLAQTVTNGDLVYDLQLALMEPTAPFGTWTGTDQFTLQQLSDAIQRRRDQFLRETGYYQTHAEIVVTMPANGRYQLSEDVLIVRRAAYLQTGVGNFNRPLLRTDDWAAASYLPGWRSSADVPRAYSTSDTPPLYFQFIPPGSDGTLDLVSINKGPAVDPLVDASLGIPDNWAWVVKYGALADLLGGDGLALDPQRAAYCEQRWQQGMDLCVRNPVILNAYNSSNAVMQLASLNEADKYSPTWQLTPGTPRKLLTAGQNLVASWPPPFNSSPGYPVTLDVVCNAPVPAVAGDILQIGQDVYDSILDLAQHIALFKQGPGELELSMALLERAARAAGIELQVQQASQPSRKPLLQQQAQDADAVPREQISVPV
jgi:hypothetical protein